MDVFVIAGPNGSGKSTSVTELLPKAINCEEYINADSIARSLSPFHPDKVSVQAGKLALKRIQNLSSKKTNFAFESTLASKSLLRYLQKAWIYSEYYLSLVAKSRISNKARAR